MKKMKIWIIDDDTIYQTIINKLILKSGVFSEHSTFSNGKEAITALNTILENNDSLPDIILLDINMPVMDGWEFLEEIKMINSKINKQIIIYIVSSSIAVEDRNKSKTYKEIFGYLTKPISINNLISIVSNHQ